MPLIFVYGALMKELDAAKPAFVLGYEVTMRLKGPCQLLEPSFATLIRTQNPTARGYGAISRLSDSEWQDLILHELSYDVVELTHVYVLSNSERANTSLEEQFFKVDESVFGLLPKKKVQLLDHPVVPSARYALMLAKGAKHVGLPRHVVRSYRLLQESGPKLSLWMHRWLGCKGLALRLVRGIIGTFAVSPLVSLLLVGLLYLTVLIVAFTMAFRVVIP